MAEEKAKKFTSLKDLAKKINKEYGNDNVIRRSDIIQIGRASCRERV